MAFRISSYTLIRSVSLLHLTAAYFFLYKPQLLTEHNMVVILGEAMQLVRLFFLLPTLSQPSYSFSSQPPTSAFSNPTEVTALVAILLAFLAISDLLAVSLPDRTCLEYWSNVLPVRLAIFFATTAYIYLFNTSHDSTLQAIKGPNASPLQLIKNSFVFSVMFLETLHWFWVFVALKEDRREWMVREATAQLRAEDERKYGGM
jgi:hypothetical protein